MKKAENEPMTPTTKKKRGPKPRSPGTTTSAGNRRNVTLSREDADKLNAVQDRLEPRLGFRPTLSQTLSWLIRNAEHLPEGQST